MEAEHVSLQCIVCVRAADRNEPFVVTPASESAVGNELSPVLWSRPMEAMKSSHCRESLDEDAFELALKPSAVDRLMEGECLVDQLDASLNNPLRKKRKVDTSSSSTSSCSSEPETEPQEEAEDDDEEEEADDDDDDEEDEDDELSSTKELLEEFANGESWQDDDDREDETEDLDSLRRFRASTRCSSTASSTIPSAPPSCTCGFNASNVRYGSPSGSVEFEDGSELFHPPTEYMDLHIRYAIDIRVTGVEVVDNHSRFLLRVADGETNKRWELHKSFKEMTLFYQQIKQICRSDAPVKRELWGTFRGLRRFHLPKKFLHFRGALLEQRRLVFDSLLRQTAALVSPAPLGPRRRRALLLLQEFVGVHRHVEVFERGTCGCLQAVKQELRAKQVVQEIFGASTSHPIGHECRSFVEALTRTSHATRSTKLSPTKANAIMTTIARKLGSFKRHMLEDPKLQTRLAQTQAQEQSEHDYDEFLDQIRHAVGSFVEFETLMPLEDHVAECLHALHSADDANARLKTKMRAMQVKPQAYFGIPLNLHSLNDWEEARRELHRMDQYSLPLDKLKCIVRAASAIFRSYFMDMGPGGSSLTSVEQFVPTLTTDEFIPIHLFVVVTSNSLNLLQTRSYLKLMCDPRDTIGEIGYYFTIFEGVIDLVQQHRNLHEPILR